MAGIGGSQSDAFTSGLNFTRNPGRANAGSITLGQDAAGADQGLDQTSARWNSLTPHGVMAAALGSGSGDDGSFEDMQRQQGSYSPGSFGQLQDQLSGGSDSLD